MSGYTIIEILVSLSFIFVIYSLLATILVEIIASMFRLRARMLRRAIRRMLQDEDETKVSWHQFVGSIMGSTLDRDFTRRFFAHPSIKYLGKNWLMKTPSYLERDVFAKTVIDILSEEEGISDIKSVENSLGYYDQFDKRNSVPKDQFNSFLKEVQDEKDGDKQTEMIDQWLQKYKLFYGENAYEFTDMEVKQVIDRISSIKNNQMRVNMLLAWAQSLKGALEIEDETRHQLCSLYKQSGKSLNRFHTLLGDWFDNTMDRTKGWYKKKIARITFLVGLVIAISFNVDSIYIVETLQENTADRQALVTAIEDEKTDNIDDLKEDLAKHQTKINSVIALADRTNVKYGPWYKYWLGWLLTAIAISLGAPFWFDLLNKLVKLKTSLPPPPKPSSGGNPPASTESGTYVPLKNEVKG